METSRPLAQALADAGAFRALFEGCFERWETAGSVRRGTPQVRDVEHVVIPAYVPLPGCLFVTRLESEVALRIAELVADKTLMWSRYGEQQANRRGPRYWGLDFRGFRHEVFCAEPHNWGCVLAIRTGSADFSRDLVTRLRRNNHRQSGGYLYRVHATRPGEFAEPFDDGTWGELIDCRDEAAFFAAAGLNVADWLPGRRDGARPSP